MSSKESARTHQTVSPKRRSSPAARPTVEAAVDWQTNQAQLLHQTNADPHSLQSKNVLRLQHTVGNRAVNKLLLPSRSLPVKPAAKTTPTPTIQRKRARPEGGDDLETYDQFEPKYESAKTKGAGYLLGLQNRKENLVLDEMPMNIHEKNYEEAQRIGHEFDTEISSEIDDGEGNIEYGMLTQHKTDGGNFYQNDIELPSGKIKADSNQAGDNKFPPSNSEVLWLQYSMALDHYKEKYAKTKGAASLSEILRKNVTNEETQAVMWMVYDNNDQTEKAVAATSEDGKALLGTPNGKSSVWLLHDHLEEIGNKTITSIELKYKKNKHFMNIKFG